MKSIVGLVLAVTFLLSPFVVAGEFADSDFLFSSKQVTVTTISSEEMQGTAGRLQEFVFDVDGFEVVIVLPEGFTPDRVGSPVAIGGRGAIFNACPPPNSSDPPGGTCIINITQ